MNTVTFSVESISQGLRGQSLTLAGNSEKNDTARTLEIGLDETLDELDIAIVTALTYTSD